MAHNASMDLNRSTAARTAPNIDASSSHPSNRPMGGGGVTLVIILFALALIGLIWAMIGMGYNTYGN
jgi:hypothetical protein